MVMVASPVAMVVSFVVIVVSFLEMVVSLVVMVVSFGGNGNLHVNECFPPPPPYLADHVEEALVALKAEKALLPAHELAVGCEE